MLRKISGWTGAFLGATVLINGALAATPAEESEKIFNTVAEELDRGGCYYEIAATNELAENLPETINDIVGWLVADDMDDSFKLQLGQIMEKIRMAVALAGIDQVEGWGFSSVRLPETLADNKKLYNNKMFLARNRNMEARGFWQWLAAQQKFPAADLGKLPAGTVEAGVMTLNIDAIFNEMLHSGMLPDEAVMAVTGQLDQPIGKDSALTPAQLIKAVSGEIRFVLFFLPQEDGGEVPAFAVQISDRDNALFQLMQTKLVPTGSFVEVDGRLEPLVPAGVLPEFMTLAFSKADNALLLVSNPEVIDYLAKAAAGEVPTLAGQADYQLLTKGLPESGDMVVFVGSRLPEFMIDFLKNMPFMEMQKEFNFGDFIYHTGGFGVLNIDADGCRMVNKGTQEFSEASLLSKGALVVIPQVIVGAKIYAQQFGHTQGWDGDEDDYEWSDDSVADCGLQLANLKMGLRRYAATHDGKYPAADGLAGLQEAFGDDPEALEWLVCPEGLEDIADDWDSVSEANNSYVYLGGADTNGTLPILFDKPGNHLSEVNVIFADGSVEAIEAENLDNCKAIVSAIQTQKRYPEADFLKLIQQAEALDKALNE